MPIDAFQSAMAIWQGSGLSIRDILDFAKLAKQEIDRLRAENYKEKYQIGMRMIAQNREAVTKFLYERYSASQTNSTDGIFISYVGGRGFQSRQLPLISKEKLLRLTNNSLRIKSQFEGEKESIRLDHKELAEEIAKWQAAGINLWDGPVYSLNNIDGAARLGFKETKFLEYRATVGSLPDELGMSLVDLGVTALNKAPLPRRKKYLSSVENLLTFNKRICAGGVNVLFAAQTKNNDLALLLQRRSLTVSDEPGSLTVIPKAFHEPIISARDEHDPEDTIYRECYEELFGGDEQSTKRHISSRFYLRYCPGVEELFNGKGKNHQLIPLGINWDLLRGNYMLNYCLYVEDPDWWDKYQHEIQVNWEVDSVAEPATLLSEANQIHDLINRQDWAPEAYFAFIEGLRWLAENVPVARNIKASLPNLILTPVS